MYMLEFKLLCGDKYTRGRTDLLKKASSLAGVGNIPAITEQKPLLDQLLHTEYLNNAGLSDFEHIRTALRDLIKYIPRTQLIYHTDIEDIISDSIWNESELETLL